MFNDNNIVLLEMTQHCQHILIRTHSNRRCICSLQTKQ